MAMVKMIVVIGCQMEPRTSGRSIAPALYNDPGSVNAGYGRVLHDNPIILSNNINLGPGVRLGSYLSLKQDFVTLNPHLVESCSGGITPCFSVREDRYLPLLSPVKGGKWAFEPSTKEFLQVQTFFHTRKSIERFHSTLKSIYDQAQPEEGHNYQTAIPANLFEDLGHWRKGAKGPRELLVFSQCHDLFDNAQFSAAEFLICLGVLPEYPSVLMAQDPTILYHELGHVYNLVMLNMRNTGLVGGEIDLGHLAYDEAGSIGEGMSDYFSYVMNGRPHIGEWGLGRFLKASRPLREDDPLHVTTLSTEDDSRLSYPAYVNYESNDHCILLEDVHNAGQIISHYLVALTEDLKSHCGMEQKTAVNSVLYLLAESFAEMGDLNARGSDYATENSINLSPDHASTWAQKVLPINFRTFAQKMGKYLMLIFNDPLLPRCGGGGVYPQERIEKLQDHYGLLLYKTYNEDGNGSTSGHSGTHTAVNPLNRLKTVLVGKDAIELDPREHAFTSYIFDKRSNIVNLMVGLISSGQVTGLSHQIENDFPYNNGNSQFSPGEVVGLVLNLYNDSNVTMGGVQVLGNDWDHTKGGKPCNTFGDNFPLDAAGAADVTGESESSSRPGDCNYITRENGDDDGESIAPICFLSIEENGISKWATQDSLMRKISLDPNKCLSGAGETRDCFVRLVSGADHSFYSRIGPKSTFGETILKRSNGCPVETENFWRAHNLVFFEVSPWTPPETTFICRFRVRFSNCDDCFTDSTEDDDDYLDYEYSGPWPFKLINYQFTVLD